MGDRANGILLDSSVAVAHLRGRIDVFALAQAGENLFLSLVVLGELYKGAEKSARVEQTRDEVESLLRRVNLLLPTLVTAKIYGRVAANLETRGSSLAENDLWIASVALEYDLPLATRDAHFNRIPGLTVLAW